MGLVRKSQRSLRILIPFSFNFCTKQMTETGRLMFQVGPLPPVAHVNGADPKAPLTPWNLEDGQELNHPEGRVSVLTG